MTERDDSPTAALLRLRVTAEGDPSLLPRLLGAFQNQNVSPRSVIAQFGATHLMHVCIDVFGLPEESLSRITARIGQHPHVLNAYWHYV